MLIKKTFHFYAAHRNQYLEGKCQNLHGHRYGVTCFFLVRRGEEGPDSHITTLFETFDQVDKMLQEEWDHSCLIDISDPLYKEISESHQQWKLKKIGIPTSAENVCYVLFHDILSLGLDLIEIHLQETDSSTVIYTVEDFQNDHAPLHQLIENAKTSAECTHSWNDKEQCNECGMSHFLYRMQQRKKHE